MRLLTITHYPALLGANRSLLHLIVALRAQHGVEVLVFCPQHGPFTEALEKSGVPFVVRPFANWAYTIRSKALYTLPWKWAWSKKKVLPELVDIARQFNPDVLHSNSSVVSLGWQLAEALQKPHLWHLREFGWPDYQVVYPFGKKYVREKLAAADTIICISDAIRQAWTQGLPCPTRVIYNGIGTRAALEKNAAAGQSAPTDDLFRFLIIGQLQASKGQHEAIAAFAAVHKKFSQARLIVAGRGQRLYTLRLKWMARLLGLSSAVTFTGYVPNPAPLYADAQVVLMCSRHEGMGRVTAEAMSYAKPVIGFAGGATPELIRHGENGFLYKTRGELTALMVQAIEDGALVKKIGERGFETALGGFTDEGYGEGVWGVANGLTENKRVDRGW